MSEFYLSSESKHNIALAIVVFIALIIAVNYREPLSIDESTVEETNAENAWNSGDIEGFKPTDGDEFAQMQETETLETTHAVIAYTLTNEERDLIERVVMGAAGCESIEGQKAVAQCILNACRITEKRPDYVVEFFQYTKNRPAPSEEVIASVSAVFDDGERVLKDEVLYFYNPSQGVSLWHESQVYVCTIENHKFFKENENG